MTSPRPGGTGASDRKKADTEMGRQTNHRRSVTLQVFGLLAGLGLLVVPAAVAAQQVTPFQTGHYYPGTSNIRDMAPPDPGVYLLWYNFSAFSGTLYDKNGNPVHEVPAGDPPVTIDISMQSLGTAPVLAWSFDLWGPLRYSGAVVPSFVGGSFSIVLESDGETARQGGSTAGIGDIGVMPAQIGFVSEHLDVGASYMLWAPTGRYATGADDNIGLGYWTHQFQASAYGYLLDKATALMVALTFETNSRVFDADERPGNRLSIEYGLSQYVTPWLELGLFGGHNFRVSDSTGADLVGDGSIYDRKSLFGGSVGVWVADWAQVTAKGFGEYDLRRRFQVGFFMVNMTFVLSDGETEAEAEAPVEATVPAEAAAPAPAE